MSESDQGGDLRSFLDLIFDKVDGALTGLELSAKKQQGYDATLAAVRHKQEQNLKVWQSGLTLLASMVELRLGAQVEQLGGQLHLRIFENPLDLDDYVELCAGRSISGGWAFLVSVSIPGFPQTERLSYVQHRSNLMYQHLAREGGPAIFWSVKNPDGFPKWKPAFENSPFALELTSRTGSGDDWIARVLDGSFMHLSTTQVADRLSEALLAQATAARGHGDAPR